VILTLGKAGSIEFRWDYSRRMRLISGRVQHAFGGRGRKPCWTTVWFSAAPEGKPVNVWGDGPHGYHTREPFKCELCGVTMDVFRSGLRFVTTRSSHTMRAKRGLKIIR
jgi:hypothetical protein